MIIRWLSNLYSGSKRLFRRGKSSRTDYFAGSTWTPPVPTSIPNYLEYTIQELLNKPDTKKILLCELDIGQIQGFWTNWRAGVWYVNFNLVYPDIDASLLTGVSIQDITRIGSVKANGISLSAVSSKEAVQENDSSFFFDDLFKALYVHCPGGDDPAIFNMMIGEAWGFANHAGVYNNFIYEGRLLSIPSISKSKDPLFFGVVSFEGGDVTIDNGDGAFDRFGEDRDVFGNSARILLGFEGLAYSQFIPLFSGFIEDMVISASAMKVSTRDKRKQLSRKLPVNAFEATAYPDIKDKNVGKPIPIAYGTIKNAPVICVNEEESPAPANYDFLLCDTEFHSIDSIIEVRVDGVMKAVSASDLDAGTFSLAAANYSPGDDVTCDFNGYVDALGNLIENGLDVVRDLLKNYYNINFNSNFFNMAHWDSSRARNIGRFLNEEKELIDIIGEIAESIQGDFIVEDDGRFAFRIYYAEAAPVATIAADQLLEIPEIEYDSVEVLSSLIVGYAKDWAEDEFLLLPDKSREETVYRKFKTYRSKIFETLLTTEADAQAWADTQLDRSGDVKKIFPVITKPQVIRREIGDLIYAFVSRPQSTMLGKVKAEIVGIDKNGDGMTVRLECRLIEILSETYVEHDAYYGDTYYGDHYYGITELRSA